MIVKCFRADNLFSDKGFILQGTVVTYILPKKSFMDFSIYMFNLMLPSASVNYRKSLSEERDYNGVN